MLLFVVSTEGKEEEEEEEEEEEKEEKEEEKPEKPEEAEEAEEARVVETIDVGLTVLVFFLKNCKNIPLGLCLHSFWFFRLPVVQPMPHAFKILSKYRNG